jgi:hypothetical protein
MNNRLEHQGLMETYLRQGGQEIMILKMFAEPVIMKIDGS